MTITSPNWDVNDGKCKVEGHGNMGSICQICIAERNEYIVVILDTGETEDNFELDPGLEYLRDWLKTKIRKEG